MGIMMKSLKPRINRQFQTRLLKIKTPSVISKTQIETYQTRTKLKVSFCVLNGTRSILLKNQTIFSLVEENNPNQRFFIKRKETGQQHLLDT
jgi:hypothetical protein